MLNLSNPEKSVVSADKLFHMLTIRMLKKLRLLKAKYRTVSEINCDNGGKCKRCIYRPAGAVLLEFCVAELRELTELECWRYRKVEKFTICVFV